MIKFENVKVVGFEDAIRGIHILLNGLAKSDSGICKSGYGEIGCVNCASNPCNHSFDLSFQLGKNDYDLMMQLTKPVRIKYRQMIVVYADIIAPFYWWNELNIYKVIQLSPNNYNQKRTVMMNYESLAEIYSITKYHKLDEWHDFCDWIKMLPWSELITSRPAI